MSRATQTDYAERILRVLVHIQQNLDGTLSLDDLATVAHFSPFHFHRIFSGMVGESVKQYVRRLRLERAASQLKHGRRPIKTIAFDAGYEAHEAFTRAFGSAFGLSPSEFRADAAADGVGAEGGDKGPIISTTRIASPAHVHYTASEKPDIAFLPLTMENLTMQIEIKTIDPMHVAFIRHVGPYDKVGETWERLCDWAGFNALFGAKTFLFGACYDDPEVTPPEKIRYDACITVDKTVQAEGEIGIQTLGGYRYAVVLHEGPYDQLGETYAALYGRWLAAEKCEPGSPPSLEFYLNDPDSTPPEELLTEICIPIQD